MLNKVFVLRWQKNISFGQSAKYTHTNQSTAKSKETSCVGASTAASTTNSRTIAADGTDADDNDAAVDVRLKERKRKYFEFEIYTSILVYMRLGWMSQFKLNSIISYFQNNLLRS